MKYRYQRVARTPGVLTKGVVYHSEDFELAALLCACGCGHRINLLVPDSHEVSDDGGFATVTPSIGVFDAPCLSHFWITAGAVTMLPAFSQSSASAIMRRQITRHVATESVRAAWWRRAIAWLKRVLPV